jgi:hypothetical protein
MATAKREPALCAVFLALLVGVVVIELAVNLGPRPAMQRTVAREVIVEPGRLQQNRAQYTSDRELRCARPAEIFFSFPLPHF